MQFIDIHFTYHSNHLIIFFHVHQVTLYRLPEELVGGDDEGAEDEKGGGVFVVEAERPVIYRRLFLSNLGIPVSWVTFQ